VANLIFLFFKMAKKISKNSSLFFFHFLEKIKLKKSPRWPPKTKTMILKILQPINFEIAKFG
jgi:hypothetical protein